MVIAPDGHFDRTHPSSIRGTTGSSDADADAQELDASGFSYFPDRQAAFRRAQGQKAIGVRPRALRSRQADAHRGRQPDRAGFPHRRQRQHDADDDRDRIAGRWLGRDALTACIAIVRGDPYRVDRIGVDGKVTRGPDLPHDVLPMTDADKQAAKGPVAAKAGPVAQHRASGRDRQRAHYLDRAVRRNQGAVQAGRRDRLGRRASLAVICSRAPRVDGRHLRRARRRRPKDRSDRNSTAAASSASAKALSTCAVLMRRDKKY